MESKLKKLQCHFNWTEIQQDDHFALSRGRYKMEDFGDDDQNPWHGHIYNALGFIRFCQGADAEALELLNKATGVLKKAKDSDGLWLLVNYGNLAWVHHHMGDEKESQRFFSMVEDLLDTSPSTDELLPEVAAEKAWALMWFHTNQGEQAKVLLVGAIEKRPQRVEWKSTLVLHLTKAHKHDDQPLDQEIWEKLQDAKEEDPENLCVAVKYLHQRGVRGESVEDEARELAQRVLRSPVGVHNGLKSILRLYREHLSIEEAVELADQALSENPGERYVKRCAALCYCWRITFGSERRASPRIIDQGISLHQDVIALYPQANLVKKINLANIFANANRLAEANGIHRDLMAMELEPPEKQVVFNNYAKHLFFNCKDLRGSLKYHMKAAEIPVQSFYRKSSIKTLQKVRDKGRHPMCREINRFLLQLLQADASNASLA